MVSFISSSLIHNLIKEGLIEEATKFLGHTYFLQGSVNKGKGLGRKLGFPTANVDYQIVINFSLKLVFTLQQVK